MSEHADHVRRIAQTLRPFWHPKSKGLVKRSTPDDADHLDAAADELERLAEFERRNMDVRQEAAELKAALEMAVSAASNELARLEESARMAVPLPNDDVAGTLTGRCSACKQHHPVDQSCSVWEQRTTGAAWWRAYVLELEGELRRVTEENAEAARREG